MENQVSTPETQMHFLDYWRVIRSRKEIVIAVAILVILSGVAYTFMQPQMYEAQSRIRVSQGSPDIDVFSSEYSSYYNAFFLKTQYEIILSKPILYKVVDNLSLSEKWGKELYDDPAAMSKKMAMTRLRNSLSVFQFRDTSLIAITVRSQDPNEASIIANEMAAVYRDERISARRREVKRGLDALRNELQKQQQRVDQAEERLEVIREENELSFMSAGIKIEKIRLQRLESDRINARVDMLTRKARLDELRSLSEADLLNASAYIVNDTSVNKLRSQLLDSEVSLRLLREDYGENHPDVKRLKAGIEELKSKLTDALNGLITGVESDYQVAKTRYETLSEELAVVKQSDIQTEKDKILPFYKAERELNIQRSILDALQARVVQEGIQMEVPGTPVELVDPAEPNMRPVSPNMRLNIIMSAALGILSGLALAYFLEYLDTSVKTIDDVEKYLGVPVIGVIPQKVKPLIEEGPEAAYAEAYRVLRTNLLFTSKGKAGGAFAVMSGGVGEGKSTTLANIAYICAQMGDKVLVVDSDLRRPVQHSIHGMSNRFGLTNLLMRDVPIEETIKQTKIPNLHFLASGRLPRSALGILDSQRVKELISNLKARYDYVFFDTPPVVGISDASILASEVDGVMLVVQYRKYPRMISLRAKQMIENVGGNILGVILNNINIMRDDYYYYYHSYYSQYYSSEESLPEPSKKVTVENRERKINQG